MRPKDIFRSVRKVLTILCENPESYVTFFVREHQVSKMKIIEEPLEKKDRYKHGIGGEKQKVSMNSHGLDKK